MSGQRSRHETRDTDGPPSSPPCLVSPVSCLVGRRCYNRLVGGKRTKPLLVLIDGHGIIHRAYHAVKVPLTVRSTGEVVTAVYGFANTLLSVFQELKPTHVAVVLDKGKPTLRIAKDATYKAHRPEMPDDLRVQIGRCRELIEAFNIPIYELEHYEADDALGALARQAADQGIETYTFSSMAYSEGKLVVKSSEALVLTFTVDAIDVEVRDIGFRGKARVKYWPMGIETPSSKVY